MLNCQITFFSARLRFFHKLIFLGQFTCFLGEEGFASKLGFPVKKGFTVLNLPDKLGFAEMGQNNFTKSRAVSMMSKSTAEEIVQPQKP